MYNYNTDFSFFQISSFLVENSGSDGHRIRHVPQLHRVANATRGERGHGLHKITSLHHSDVVVKNANFDDVMVIIYPGGVEGEVSRAAVFFLEGILGGIIWRKLQCRAHSELGTRD